MKDFSSSASSNAVEGTKRMASSMSPVIVLRDGKPFMALGTSGGAAIPSIIANVLINVIANKRSLDDAIAAPRYDQQATPEDIAYEQGRAPKALLDALTAMGHGIRAIEGIGDVQAVMIDRGKLVAVSDPRHGGSAGAF
jgi:gamma-glutamyltranspeptidase/glutathione hydrolase